MKIAIFTDTFFPKVDGVVTSIMNFTNGLVNKGHTFMIFCPRYESRNANPFKKGVSLVRFPSASLPSYKQVKIVLVSPLKLRRSMERFKPDVIHIQTPGSLGWSGVEYARSHGIPCLGTYHTLVSEQMTYIMPHWIRELVGQVLSGGKSHNPSSFLKKSESESLLKKFGWTYSLGIYNKCNLILTPSLAIKKLLIRKKVKTPVEVLSNGVNLKRFTPKKSYTPRKPMVIVNTGRFSFEKNTELILAAAARLKKKYDFVLHMAGDGPARPYLEHQAAELGIDDIVDFKGWVLRDTLTKIIKAGDFFVTASPMETQGLAVLEAMACGLPMVGVRRYALPEIIKPGKNGFLATPYSASSLAKAMEQMILKKKSFAKLGKQSRAIAETHDLKLKINKLEGIYQRMVK